MTSHDSCLECIICGKCFAHATTLREHENYSCQARVLFVCIPCGMTFDSNHFLDQHLIRHKRGESLLLDKSLDLDNPEHKCDLCKTPFVSPFTLATHQLYSCPAICECALGDLSKGTTTSTDEEPGTSDDEGKLKIVEDVFKCKKNKLFNKKKSKSQKLPGKISNGTGEKIESISKNNSENENVHKHGKIIPVYQLVKDVGTRLDFGLSKYENGVPISNVLKTNETQTKLSNIDKEEKSYSSIERPGKEPGLAPKPNTTKENKLLLAGGKSGTNETELMNNLIQEVKMPLRMVLKLKNIVDNVTLAYKTNELHPATKPKASALMTATSNSRSGNNDEKKDVISNVCVNNNAFENERGLDGTKNTMKLLAKNEQTSARSFKRKTYPCRVCGRCFAYEETRACHENVICVQDMASKERGTYACTKCKFVFQDSNSFDLHAVMKCCSKLETLNTRVLNHVNCQYCARTFVRAVTLATHLEYCCTRKTKEQDPKEMVSNPVEKKGQVSHCN